MVTPAPAPAGADVIPVQFDPENLLLMLRLHLLPFGDILD